MAARYRIERACGSVGYSVQYPAKRPGSRPDKNPIPFISRPTVHFVAYLYGVLTCSVYQFSAHVNSRLEKGRMRKNK